MALHQWDYLFAFGTIFAALDAYNIGANDVANSFATSVGSRSLTLLQASLAAAVMEFLGGVLVGARVSGTIKNSIIGLGVFQGNAGVQLLAFTVAITCSASWLMVCTRYGWPVSTTYSIVSAIAGVGVAIGGADAVQWGWNDGKGLATIFAGFIIAPAISAGFASVVYLITKYGVLVRKNSLRAAFFGSPIFFFTVATVMTMVIIYKGSPTLNLDDLPGTTLAAAIVGTGAVVAVLSVLFWLPYVYCKTVRNDYTLRFYHFFLGPLLWRREAPADALDPGARSAVPDYRVRKDEPTTADAGSGCFSSLDDTDNEKGSQSDIEEPHKPVAPEPSALANIELHPLEGPWYLPGNLWIIARHKSLPWMRWALTRGVLVDVHAMQDRDNSLAEIHKHAVQYDNKTEHLYSFIQVVTACTASFAHGANDLGNAVGPYSAIYAIWSSGQPAGKNTDTPVWILVAGAALLVLGLATYGYNIMAVLGNKLTLHSPSRGYSMELGAAITVLLASQYGIPVSTTMCITGATLGVAMCNGDWRSFNWKQLGWIVLGWVITVPVVGVLAGCTMGILLNAPHF
ncbi:sodium:inorganic phosphate symporter [Epithele typhae]|uniref:sodium:inorganic phosphate symporter n=1 Tax=Epithele typhae TaxID=378194 RepID=UPI0020074C7B|nr:sodium:inorganic phosphate symporter [Epithele typhae]KAH9943506.1 sodium:inorganic phosphate symporter [Epithele typhae]